MTVGKRPPATEFVLRILLAATLVLALGRTLEVPLAGAAAAALRAMHEGCGGDFSVTAMGVGEAGGERVLWLRANLAHPVSVGGRVILPFGSAPGTGGGIQVTLTTGGLLLDAQLLLVLVLAWPASGSRELLLRLCYSLPTAAALWLSEAAVTSQAELWFPLHNAYAPAESWPLLELSRALMAGGGQALAVLGAMAVLRVARPSQVGDSSAPSGHA
jgi:hypothetical protein